MAISKIILNGDVQMDVTQDTVTASTLMSGETAHDAAGIQITGTASGGSIPFPVFDVTWDDDWIDIVSVTCNMTYADCRALSLNDADYRASIYEHDQSQTYEGYLSGNNVAVGTSNLEYTFGGSTPYLDIQYNSNGTITWTYPSASVVTAGTPTATKGSVSNHSLSVTPSVTNPSGYIAGSTITGTPVSVSASELVSGTLSITSNGTHDVTNYASATVNVSGGGGDYSLVRCYVKGGNSYTYARVVGASSLTGLVSVKQIPSSSEYTEIYVPRRDANTGILIASGVASYYWARMSEGTGATEISSSSETTNIAVEDDAYVIIYVNIRD